MQADMFGKMTDQETPASWLLKYGQEFNTNIKRPKGVTLMKLKECYSNSSKTLMFDDLDKNEWFYCEGYAASKSLSLPLEHAWLANKNGDVIDRTWRYSPGDCAYFGVPFKYDYMLNTIMRNRYYGLLSDGCTYNRQLLQDSPEVFRAWQK